LYGFGEIDRKDSPMARRDVIEARIAKLVDGFGRYVQTYDDRAPFSQPI
jgi:hypothetical protein